MTATPTPGAGRTLAEIEAAIDRLIAIVLEWGSPFDSYEARSAKFALLALCQPAPVLEAVAAARHGAPEPEERG